MEILFLEFMKRVKFLEKRVDELEMKLAEINQKDLMSQENQEGNEEINDGKITRKNSRKYVMDEIEKIDSLIRCEKGGRNSNTDIKIFKNGKEKNIKIKLYHSKSYNEAFPAGWIRVMKNEVNKYDFYIFSVIFKTEYKIFIFEKKEIGNIIKSKVLDKNQSYHFYFQCKSDGKIVECREKEHDIKNNLENWLVLEEFLKSI